jgi:beta-xylosidase
MRRLVTSAAIAATLLASTAAAAQDCPGRSGEGVSRSRLGAGGPHRLTNSNFPDPFVARFGGTYFAYATGNQTGGGQMNVQTIRSRDLSRWSAPAEALPAANLPAWVDRRHPQVWAPEVNAIGGRYVLYFNARHRTLTRTETPPDGPHVLQRHCLGAAVAQRPEGPYLGIDDPLVCAEHESGAIDANVFGDAGNLYLYYKEDGNCCGPNSAIYVQGLSPDGLAALGPRHLLVASNDSPEPNDDWEWRVVEAPTMVRRGEAYFLFYSGNFFGNRNYAVAYLRCATPRGPCRDPGDNPILRSHPGSPLIGPGHQSLLEERGRSYLFYHGWNADPDGREQPGVHKRCLYVSRLRWEPVGRSGAERPVIDGGEPPQ